MRGTHPALRLLLAGLLVAAPGTLLEAAAGSEGEGGDAGAVPVYTNADLPESPQVSIIGGLETGAPALRPPIDATDCEEGGRPRETRPAPVIVPVPRGRTAVGATCVYGDCRPFRRSIFGGRPFGTRRQRAQKAPEPVHLKDALPPPLGGFVGRPGKHLGPVPGMERPRHPRRSHRPPPRR